MAVKVGSARIDENGHASGGKAGDQTGKEVSTQDWYLHSKGWVVLRAKDANVRETIARCMQAACDNKHVGYDQGQRDTLYNASKSLGFDVSKVTKNVETDCSALVRVCVNYAGIAVGNFTTPGEASVLMNTGAFLKYTDDTHCKKSTNLLRGDILVTKTKGHTVVVLSDGANADAERKALSKVAPPVESMTETPTTGVVVIEADGGAVNVRSGNGTKYAIITTVKDGTVFDWVATADNGWHAVVVGTQVGWVSGKYGRRAWLCILNKSVEVSP